MLNMLSNAIKFTPEGGRIEVLAQSMNGSIEVAGVTPASASRPRIRLHGGRIWVKSEVGMGSRSSRKCR